jgi:hypothetical protein
VTLTFAKGAALLDRSKLFDASLNGNVRRAIDIREGDKLGEKAFKALIRAAATLNTEIKEAALRRASLLAALYRSTGSTRSAAAC